MDISIPEVLFILSIIVLYFLPRKSQKYKLFWIIPLLFFLLNLWIRFYRIEQRHESSKKLSELEAQLDTTQDIQDYTIIAQYNMRGAIGDSGVIVSNPISTILNGCFPNPKNGKQTFFCTEEALLKYREVTDKYPNFPFGYYCLAFCLRKKQDPNWKPYAKKAQEILEITTQVTNRSMMHEEALKNITILLDKK